MKRRNMLSGKAAWKIIKSHLLFIFILTFGSFIRISMEEDSDRNVTMFAILIAVGVIFGISLFNQFAIDLFNDLNHRWTIVNYCVPAILIMLIIFIFKIPVDLIDVVALAVLILIADLLMYSLVSKSNPGKSH